LKERTDGYTFSRQLKVHIEKVLNITIFFIFSNKKNALSYNLILAKNATL